MGQLTVQEERRQAVVQIRDTFDRMAPELQAALPAHVTVEKFTRVVMTAVNSDPNLLSADRKSLYESAVKSAQDGLLPDKREGAFVIYNGKVQWLPMIAGVLKKMRNSGELLEITVEIAYKNDHFKVVFGDNARIEHEPFLGGDRGAAVAAYAIGKTKAGGIYREVMTLDQIEKVRAVSRAARNGPWVTWWDEMAKKTVLRRLAKRMPQSTDIERVLSRDDEMYDLERKQLLGEAGAARLFSPVANPLSDEPEQIPHDPDTGEINNSDANDGSRMIEGTVNRAPPKADPAGAHDAAAGQGTPAGDPGFGRSPEAAAGEADGAGQEAAPSGTRQHHEKAWQHGYDTGRANRKKQHPAKITDEDEKSAWYDGYEAAVLELDAANS